MKMNWITPACSALLVLGSVSIGGEASAAPLQWQAFNTCWSDFDVGGGWLCMLRTPQCATAGISENDRLHCTSTVGSGVPPSYGQVGLDVPPASKGLALDDNGYVWLIGNDNKIYAEDNQGGGWGLFASSGLSCIKKLAVTLNSTGTVPRVLALGCDASKTLKRYASGAWSTVATNVYDATVTTLDGVSYLTYVSNTAGRPWYRSGATGTGAFTLWKGNTQPTEHWTYQGTNYSQPFTAGYFGGFYGLLLGYADCAGTGVGQHWFYDYEDDFFVGPDPTGCNGLQIPAGSGAAIKVQAGNRGPGNDLLWVLMSTGRVFGYLN